MTLNAYYVGAFKTASGRTLYAARICCPLLDCEHEFDSQEDAESFITRETASLAEYGIVLHKVNAPAELTNIQRAYQDGAGLYRKETHGYLGISERRWMYYVTVSDADAEKISETCREIAALNGQFGFAWEPSQCGNGTYISVFCNWWEEQQIDAVLDN